MRKTLNENRLLYDICGGITSFGLIFSYMLCAGVCSGADIIRIFTGTVICAAASLFLKDRVLTTDAFLLLPVLYISAFAGAALLPFALICAAVFYYLLKKLFKDLTLSSGASAGAQLGLAFAVTVMMTTLYFGIGASGDSVWNMLRAYRYLGFHPNWRGVFYGTITLFAMITYPFKFKKLNRYLPAEVFSLLIPFVLNLWLNPDGETTPILEVSSLAFLPENISVQMILPVLGTPGAGSTAYLAALKGALCIAAMLAVHKTPEKKDSLCTAGANLLNGAAGCAPVREYEIFSYSPVSAVICILLAVGVCFGLPGLIARVPVHSLAVVLIVSAWKRVKFSQLADCFKENGMYEVLTVIIIFAAFIFADLFTALLVCGLLSAVSRRTRE